MIRRLLERLIGCRHHHTSRAFYSQPQKRNYVVCMNCGRRFWYDWQQMTIGTEIREQNI